MALPTYLKLQELFQDSGLKGVFLECLGWESADDLVRCQIEDKTYTGAMLAHAGRVAGVFSFEINEPLSLSEQKAIAQKLARYTPDRIIQFVSPQTTSYLWPKRTASGHSFEEFPVPTGSMPTFLAQRLTNLEFTSAEHKTGIPATLIRERVRGTFDATKVTQKFYGLFLAQREALASAVSGLGPTESASYSNTILYRLMLIYFLQKKGFLNNDSDYLRNCQSKLEEASGPGKFYKFYQDLLLELFQNGLNSPNPNYSEPLIKEIIGKVPYINGGLFEMNELEASRNIDIPDSTFTNIFNFFDQFVWHLDTRPTGNPNEINPEVIGYIFQQLITATESGKKEDGAYYTPVDVTSFMVRQSLVPRVLDILVDNGIELGGLLPNSRTSYLNDEMLHGWDFESEEWLDVPPQLLAAWKSDASEWGILDEADWDGALCLAEESWVEMFYRRTRVEVLLKELELNQSWGVNDALLKNLNIELIVSDAISKIKDQQQFEAIWRAVESISVIDPTCGSGAFLFAAMESMEDIYEALLERLSAFPNSFGGTLVAQLTQHANRRYFVRKQIALRNLYGTDLKPEAIEISKLRIFLALASCLEAYDEIEPLPDLDFNLRVGNLVVGILDPEDYSVGGNQLVHPLADGKLKAKISNYIDLYRAYQVAQESNGNSSKVEDQSMVQSLKTSIAALGEILNGEVNQVMGQHLGLTDSKLEAYVCKNRPFHWFIEFPEVISRGGFDVIIGNPPYIPMQASKPRKQGIMWKKDFLNYLTNDCSDFYAICYERSLQLLNTRGRHSFIVPINLATSSRFDSLRKLISQTGRNELWSTFGLWPDSLFRGVGVRNTILALGPGDACASTRLHVFTRSSRKHMFETLEYVPNNRTPEAPPSKSGVATPLVEYLAKGEVACKAAQETSEVFWFRDAGNYWFPVVLDATPNVDRAYRKTKAQDPYLKNGPVLVPEDKDVLIASLAGKIGYLIWMALGDNFHTALKYSYYPRLISIELSTDPEVVKRAVAVVEAGKALTFVNFHSKVGTINIRWNGAVDLTDRFDSLALEKLGVPDFWRLLNIWYRQTMKSTGDNLSSTYIDERERAMIGLTW